MSMQKMPRLEGMNLIYCRQQAVDAAFWGERSAKVRHHDVADEQHALIRHMHQQGIVGRSTGGWQQLEACPADDDFGRAVDGHVRLIAEHVVEAELIAEESLDHGRICFRGKSKLFAVIAS